jgi:hypothetical protein
MLLQVPNPTALPPPPPCFLLCASLQPTAQVLRAGLQAAMAGGGGAGGLLIEFEHADLDAQFLTVYVVPHLGDGLLGEVQVGLGHSSNDGLNGVACTLRASERERVASWMGMGRLGNTVCSLRSR